MRPDSCSISVLQQFSNLFQLEFNDFPNAASNFSSLVDFMPQLFYLEAVFDVLEVRGSFMPSIILKKLSNFCHLIVIYINPDVTSYFQYFSN